MFFRFQNSDMLEWLKTQVRVLEAWREDVASRPDIDFDLVCRLEQHYQWLTSEVLALERTIGIPHHSQEFQHLRSVG